MLARAVRNPRRTSRMFPLRRSEYGQESDSSSYSSEAERGGQEDSRCNECEFEGSDESSDDMPGCHTIEVWLDIEAGQDEHQEIWKRAVREEHRHFELEGTEVAEAEDTFPFMQKVRDRLHEVTCELEDHEVKSVAREELWRQFCVEDELSQQERYLDFLTAAHDRNQHTTAMGWRTGSDDD
jgi:hypothetical protein